jgi:hypothetical protein
VLVDTDLGWFASVSFERQFRARLLQELSLPAEAFLFTLSHTHSAPPLSNPEPTWQGGELLPGYIEQVFSATVQTTRAALAAARPAVLEWHTGRCAVAANRDLPVEGRIACGFHPEGVPDDTLLVGRISDEAGAILGTVVHYACHPTTLGWENKLISPDFVGAMRETVAQASGGAPVFFLQGASGELAPRYQYVGDPAVADAYGREIGYAALATLAGMQPPGQALVFDRVVESGAPLAVWSRHAATPSRELRPLLRTVNLPLKEWPSAAELEQQYSECADRAMAERLRRKLRIRQDLGDGESFPLEIYAWRIGDAVILGTMMEVYSCLQQRLRARFAAHPISWLNLVNGSLGYLAPAPLYDGPELYQVWQTPCERGSLELLETAVIELLDELLAS